MFTAVKLIPRYVIKSALPYALLALALLTAILMTQQSGRFAELALYADLPLALAAEIAAALLPSVLILTLPVAVLAGIVIGFARMGSDSEVVAMRAAGVGTWTSAMARLTNRLAGHRRDRISTPEGGAPGSPRSAPRRLAGSTPKTGISRGTSHVQYRNTGLCDLRS